MVSPAKPNANGLAPAKTPKEPKAPKQEALIPPDLARQKIPPPETTKKLTDNTISPKDAPTTLDESVTQKAQKVLGIEEKTEDIESNLDFFDDFMKAEATPAETISETPVDQPSENIEEDLDFFDDFMKADAPTSDKVTEPKDDQPAELIEDGLDFFDDFMKEEAATPDESPASSSEQIATHLNATNETKEGFDFEDTSLKILDELDADSLFEFNDNINNKQLELNDFIVPGGEQLNTLADLENLSLFILKGSNTIYSKKELNDQTRKEIYQFIRELNLDADKLASLKIVHLNEDQWKQITEKLSFLIQQKQNLQKSALNSTNEETEEREVQKRATTQNIDAGSQKKLGKMNKREATLIKELASEIVEEEILKQERAKLREKRASEKEHRILEKEIQNWERKHEEIKKDADVKRRTP